MSQINRLHQTEDLESVSNYIYERKPFQTGNYIHDTCSECQNSSQHPAHTRPPTLAQNYSTVTKQEEILDELNNRIFNMGVKRRRSLDELLKAYGRKELPYENAIFEQEKEKAELEASEAQNLSTFESGSISREEYAQQRATTYVAREVWKTKQAKIEYEMYLLKGQTDDWHEGHRCKYHSRFTELDRLVEEARRVLDAAWVRIDEDVRWYREEQAILLRNCCESPFQCILPQRDKSSLSWP